MVERLLLVVPFWIAALVFLALRRHYTHRNLLLVAFGSGSFLAALAVDPEAGALIAVGAIGALLWVRGTDAERERQSGDRESAPPNLRESI
jgi:hypothetical protein